MNSLNQLLVFIAIVAQLAHSSFLESARVDILSPINNGYYLQDAGGILPSVLLLVAEELLGKPPPELVLCTTISKIIEGSSLDGQQVPPQRETISTKCSSSFEIDPLKVVTVRQGSYSIEVKLTDKHDPHQFSISSVADFHLGRKMFKEAVLGSKPPPLKVDTETLRSLRNQKDVMVLAVKYGIHGDDASISVAVNGNVVLRIPLDIIFRIEEPEIRRKLTEVQKRRKAALQDPAYELEAKDEVELSHHLALQAATGFANGCDGVFVTTAGVTRMCHDSADVLQNWIDVKHRVQNALLSLWDNNIEQDDEGDVVFDAIVFVSGDGDKKNETGTVLNHVLNVFKYKHIAVDDDCQAPGDAALTLWGGYHDLNGESDDAILSNPVFTSEQPLTTLGVNEDDKLSPKVHGLTTDATSFMRTSLRTLKRTKQPFTVCRPGLGYILHIYT